LAQGVHALKEHSSHCRNYVEPCSGADMLFPAGPQPAYFAVRGNPVSRTDFRFPTQRTALLLGGVVLLGVLCFCAVPGAPTGITRGRPSSVVALDEGGAGRLGNGSLLVRAEGKVAPRPSVEQGASEFEPEVASAEVPLQNTTLWEITTTTATKKNESGHAPLDRVEPVGSALALTHTIRSSKAEQQRRRNEREEHRRQWRSRNSSGQGNAPGASKGGSPERREANKQLRYVFEEAAAAAASVCTQNHTAYVPLDMRHHRMSYENSADACQQRCAAIEGCKTFTFFPADKSCHVQDGNTIQLYSAGSQTGKPNCNSIFRKL